MRNQDMKIQVNTDNHIHGSEELTRQVVGVVEGTLDRFSNRITRVEVHLTDENSSAKSRGNDIRCVMEARPASQQPITVSHDAATLEEAVNGAAEKLEKTLDRTFGRMDDHKGRQSFAGDQTN
jgi:ribosome-associated translation inhibitor RaiA